MRGVLWVVLFLLAEPTLAGLAYANNLSAVGNAASISTPIMSQKDKTLNTNLQLLKNIWMKSRLLAEVPDANIKSAPQNDPPTDVGLKLVEMLPPAFQHMLSSEFVTSVLTDASQEANTASAFLLLGNRTVAETKPHMKTAIDKVIGKAEQALPLLMGTFMQSRSKSNGSAGSAGVQALQQLMQKVSATISAPGGMKAGRPSAAQLGKPSGSTTGLSLGIMFLFALVVTLIPILEYVVTEGHAPGPKFGLGNYTANTVYSLFAFFLEYIFIMFALCFVFFHKITSLSSEYEQTGANGAIFYGHVFLVVLLPLAFIISLATGVARPAAYTESDFTIHIIVAIFLTIPGLLLFVVLIKTIRLKGNDDFLTSAKKRFVEMGSAYSTRRNQQRLSAQDISEIKTLLAWYGNRQADMARGVTDSDAKGATASDGTGNSARDATTFQSLVFSDNCRLVDNLMAKYHDEFKQLACEGQNIPACDCNKAKSSGGQGAPATLVKFLRHLYTLGPDAGEENVPGVSLLEVEVGTLKKEKDVKGSKGGPIVYPFRNPEPKPHESAKEAAVTLNSEEMSLSIDYDFNAVGSSLFMPRCSSLFDPVASTAHRPQCPYALSAEHSCQCNLPWIVANINDNACVDFCIYNCVANEAFQRAHLDVQDFETRNDMPEAVEHISNQYLAYFITLALVLAAIGRFFGVAGECAPLMLGDRISPVPHCASTSAGGDCGDNHFPMIPNSKHWTCSSDATKIMKQGTSCILECADGFSPVHGVTQCVSGGFMLTYWSHLKADFTYSTEIACKPDYDVCKDMFVSLVEDGSKLKNEATASQFIPTTLENTASLVGDTYTSTQKLVQFSGDDHVLVTDSRISAEAGSAYAQIQLSATAAEITDADEAIFSWRVGAQDKPFIKLLDGTRLVTDDNPDLDYVIGWQGGDYHELLITWSTDTTVKQANGEAYPEHTRLVNINIDGVLVKETVTEVSEVTGFVFGNCKTDKDAPFSSGRMKNMRLWASKLLDPVTAGLSYTSICPLRMEEVDSANANAAMAHKAMYPQMGSPEGVVMQAPDLPTAAEFIGEGTPSADAAVAVEGEGEGEGALGVGEGGARADLAVMPNTPTQAPVVETAEVAAPTEREVVNKQGTEGGEGAGEAHEVASGGSVVSGEDVSTATASATLPVPDTGAEALEKYKAIRKLAARRSGQ